VNEILNEAEGWCIDPYERHELRWFSAGRPTALVRDNGVDGRDEPPATPPPTRPVAAPEVEVPATAAYDAQDAANKASRAAFGNLAV
jgi:hypothetical protein